MKKTMDQFSGLYGLSKTLRFELRPIRESMEHFELSGLLDHDKERAEDYKTVKQLLDEQHKKLLERSLSSAKEIIPLLAQDSKKTFKDVLNEEGTDFAWDRLADAIEQYRAGEKGKEEKASLEKVQKSFRKAIAAILRQDVFFEPLVKDATPSKFFKARIKQAKEEGKSPEKSIATFGNFACYFKGYQENRKNIYSDEAQKTAAPNRAVNENFPKFLEMIRIYEVIQERYPDILNSAKKELAELIGTIEFKDIFTPSAYTSMLSQKGIDRLNNLIGGYTISNKKKIQGINEIINNFRNTHEEARNDRALHPMPKLFKQILSDRDTISFIPEMFEDDKAVISALTTLVNMFENYQIDSQTVNLFDELESTLKSISANSEIYVDAAELSTVSKNLCGSWNTIADAMEEYAQSNFKTKKDREKWLNKSEYTLGELNSLDLTHASDNAAESCTKSNIADAWRGEKAKKVFEDIASAKINLQKILVMEKSVLLRESKDDKDDIEKIKNYLESIKKLLHFIKPLNARPESCGDPLFYGRFDQLYAGLEIFIPLYNSVRNYVTKKAAEKEKIKLMFDNPTLADGWSNETANGSVIFRDGKFYYLGVLNPEWRNIFQEKHLPEDTYDAIEKMMYYKIGSPGQSIPGLMVINGRTEKKNGRNSANGENIILDNLKKRYLPPEINRIRESKSFNHNPQDLIKYIDYYKERTKEYFANCCFVFRNSCEYENFPAFIKHAEEQAYQLRFEKISKKYVYSLVHAGKLFLFQLSNKDFSESSEGTKNLYTIYWESLFSPQNLANVTIELCGKAEIFWRDKVITKPFVHHVGEKMVNRYFKGKQIPESVFGELFDYVNYKKTLSKEAEALLKSGKVKVRDVPHEIIKDRRFTKEKLLFHVPITINFKAPDRPRRFNDSVAEYLRNNPDVNIIGIDRGERNLIYWVRIDQKGNILGQNSFNKIKRTRYDGSVYYLDYHEKLNQRERERDEARKSWNSIGKIKDLKAGYLSQVVHEISKMMIRHNAIIILEDLNFGFKRGRFCIEKQVYQKFEKALIDKLNYLVFKDRDINEPGGCLKGYQLTDAFTGFEKLGKQTGFIFYVPAGYTSKIDPTTGFTNLFNTKKCTNAENRKAFFEKFDSIRFDSKLDSFAFAFDYRNFKTSQESWKTDWIVYSAERRLVFDPKAKGERTIYPTQIIKDALKSRNVISLSDGFDLLAYLKTVPADKVNAEFFSNLFYAFDRTLQMRNSKSSSGEDYIQSPVMGRTGKFFKSDKTLETAPKDADANGAYHIALKGLYLLQNAFNKDQANLKIEHKNWFEFVQKRNS